MAEDQKPPTEEELLEAMRVIRHAYYTGQLAEEDVRVLEKLLEECDPTWPARKKAFLEGRDHA